MTPKPRKPYGCLWCGDEEHHHGQQWTPIVGMHPWTAPHDRLILERMLFRLAARPARPITVRDRLRAVHADAYPSPDGDPVCATCHRTDCPATGGSRRRPAARRRASPPAGRRLRRRGAVVTAAPEQSPEECPPGPAWWEETPAEASRYDRYWFDRDEE